MSEIRVTSVVGENGGDRVGLTTGLTVDPDWNNWCWCNNNSSRSRTICVCTATSFSEGENLTGMSYVKILQASGTSISGNQINFDNLDVSTYKSFDLIGGFRPAADATIFRMRFRTGGAAVQITLVQIIMLV